MTPEAVTLTSEGKLAIYRESAVSAARLKLDSGQRQIEPEQMLHGADSYCSH